MRWLAASLAAVCASVLASVALAFPFGGLGPGVAAASLFAGLAVGLLAFRRTAGADPRGKRVLPTGWEWLPIAVFVLFSLRAFCWLIFVDDDDIKILSPNNLGDMAIHLTYINYLASGIHFWPQEPIFPGHPLRYPVGTDLFNSLLLLCHFDLYRGLVWTGLAGCAATGLALYEWGGAFTLAGFLFNGGAWGLAFFLHPRIKDFQADYAWKSIPLAMFVTQRGLLYALPAGLLLLISWRDRFFRGKPGRIPFWLEVLFYGSMPLFHVHTFIFLSLLLGCWAAIGLAPRRPLVALVAWSLVPATVLVGLVCGFSDGGSIVHLVDLTKGGLWTQGSDNFFKYWLGNFGILPVLAALLAGMLLHSRKPEDRQAMAFVLPGAAIFLFACVVILAPWDWDNIKLLLWCYLAVLPFLWRDLLAGRSFPVRAGACAALFFSGFLSLFGGIDASHTGYDLAKRSELDGLRDAIRPLPLEGVIFAGMPTYNHPLLLLGRKMVMGYPGHLWSHGYDYEGREAQLKSLMMGEPGWRVTAAALKVRYLFWGQKETDEYPSSPQPWKGQCAVVASGEWGALYDLERPAKK